MRRPSPSRVLVTVTATTALAVGLTSTAIAAPPLESRPEVPADAPLTPFEANGGTAWTTLEEEAAFLAEVDALSDVMTLETTATTPQGRPIRLVRLGAATDAPAGEEPTAMLVCSQHGNEPSGREACLRYVRDLALGTDENTTLLLERSGVLVMPSANPDGTAADTRGNAAGIDVNRDHLTLETVEGQAVARLLRDESPDTIVDVHEYGGIPGSYDRDLIYLWPRNLNVTDATYGLARELSEVWTERSVTSAGFTTGIYGIVNSDPPRQVAGDEDERIFRNMGGLRHVASQLIETYVDQRPGETPEANRNQRVDSHVAALDGAVDFFSARGRALAVTQEASQRRAAAEGATGAGPFYLAGADNDPPTAEEQVEPPCSYTLDAGQLAAVATTLDLHGIAVTTTGDGGATVSMGQSARNVIPFLLDGRTEYSPVDATPVAC